MDAQLANKLESVEHEDFRKKLLAIAAQHISLGRRQVDYFSNDFDVSHDLFQCYAQLGREDLEKLEGGHPRRFILPITSTQITTMATFIAQALFGTAQPNRVEARSPDSEFKAAMMNQLLRWNAERQPAYLLGHMWVIDCLLYNRGIMYENYRTITKSKVTEEEVDDKTQEKKEDGTWPKVKKWVRRREEIGGYNHVMLISPYDFICDPGLPMWRLQEMRFMGHRARVPWIELKKRSELDPSNPSYVSPRAVQELKLHKPGATLGASAGTGTPGTGGTASSTLMSRTAYDRARPTSPLGNEAANKEDGGIVEVYELWIQLVPKANEIGESSEVQTWQFLVGNQKELLSLDESISAHDEFPYSVGESRPSPHYQMTPSWAMMLKPLQDYIDYLKNRRQEAISNTLGNIFIARPSLLNLEDFLDPKKEGKIITVNEEGSGKELNDIIKQIPINDVTAQFSADVTKFITMSDLTSGASSQLQGQGNDNPASNEASAQQMALGRLSSIARMLSTQALVPQTRRMVSNFQQFFSKPMMVRVKGSLFDLPQELIGKQTVEITRDTIAGEFDFVPHDGMLPLTDGKRVAALTRILESASAFPFMFDPTVEGNLNIRRVMAEAIRASGVNIENMIIKKDEADANKARASGAVPPGGAPPADLGAPAGAPQLPPIPSSSAPRDIPAGGPGLTQPSINLAPTTPAVRPANV